jgi:hypothetical protein
MTSNCFGVKTAKGIVEDLPLWVSILTQYGDSNCCVSEAMRHPFSGVTKVADKISSILARIAVPARDAELI